MKNRLLGIISAAVLCTVSVPFAALTESGSYAYADEWYFAGETCEPLHDTTRDVQKEGVGNPLNFTDRNTPADASTEEIRAINHKMSVQEVKYALYKEIDEHWDLISKRIGQTDREKVYALFLGLGSRESTLGEGKIGADHETAYEDGWGVNSAHAYGTLQTAVTAFADNVPEMFQYSFTESNFYDAIISNHMGIRKILHFVEICINEEHMHGYQVIRNSLKGFNTGWCYMAEDDGAYKTYADEICSMAQFYYYEGHLYDNVFTWTSAGGEMEKYRTADRWESWWGDGEPSMEPVEATEPATGEVTEPSSDAPTGGSGLCGDANCDEQVNMADAVIIMQSIANPDTYKLTAQGEINADTDGSGDITNKDALTIQQYRLNIITALPHIGDAAGE